MMIDEDQSRPIIPLSESYAPVIKESVWLQHDGHFIVVKAATYEFDIEDEELKAYMELVIDRMARVMDAHLEFIGWL